MWSVSGMVETSVLAVLGVLCICVSIGISLLSVVLMYFHTAHRPQPIMCSPVANLHRVAKLDCVFVGKAAVLCRSHRS